MRLLDVQGRDLEVTNAIRQHLQEKAEHLAPLCKGYSPCELHAQVGKTSGKQQKGDIFEAKLQLTIPGGSLRAEVVKDDLYAAIDQAVRDLKRQLAEHKDKQKSLGR